MKIFFIIFVLVSCQTLTPGKSKKEKEQEIVKAEKAIIINYLNKGQSNKAHVELRAMLKKYPNDPDFKNFMGLCQLSFHNPSRAEIYFKKAYKIKKSAAFALNLSSAYIEGKKYIKAIKLLKKIKKIYPDYKYPERFFHNMALAWENLNKNGLAEKYYKLALNENPYNYMTIMQFANFYIKNNNKKLAILKLEEAKNTCGLCYEPIKLLAVNYLQIGKPKKAANVLKEFIIKEHINDKDKKAAIKMVNSISKSQKKSK